jgi:transposase
VLPKERYVDSGYVGGNTIAASRLLGEDLVGPLRRGSSPQQRQKDGLTHADFHVDWDAKQVMCPQGHTTLIFPAGKLNDYQATFAAKLCRDCPLRPRCCAGTKEGRSLRFGAYYPETVAARERQETAVFKEAYKQHRPEVEGCLSALVRGQGIRTTR